MAFLLIISKAEKNFFNFKLICVASTIEKVEFQTINSFDIATIDSAYLNNFRYIYQFNIFYP